MTLPGPVRRPAASPTSCTRSRCRSSSTTWRSGAAASPPTSPSAWACLGLRPILVGAVGRRLRRLPLLAGAARRRQRPRCTCPSCTTPPASSAPPTRTMNQIASFYAGAMSEARQIELSRSPTGPAARPGPHRRRRPRGDARGTPRSAASAAPLRRRPLAAARPDGRRGVRELIDGAAYLFTNEYEAAPDSSRRPAGPATRSSPASGSGSPPSARRASGSTGGRAVDARRPRPRGREGRADRASATRSAPASSPPCPGACRLERAAQLGNLLAAHALEAAGPQEYTLHGEHFVERFADAYGKDAAGEVAQHL